MAAGSGKIVLDVDATRAIAESKKLGDEFKKNTGHASELGKEFEELPGKLAKSVIGARELVKLIRETAEAIRELQKQRAEASKEAGGTALEAGIAGARLGLGSQDVEAITSGGSARSEKDLGGFLKSLADTKGPGKQELDRQSVFRASQLFRSGLFDQKEILEAAGKGRLDELLAGSGRRAELIGEKGLGELQIRAFESQRASEALGARAQQGERERLIAAQLDAQRAKHGAAGVALQLIGKTPLVGIASDAVVHGVEGGRADEVLRQIANNTKPRPAVVASPDKQ